MLDGLAPCLMIAAWLVRAGARAAHVRKQVIVAIGVESILNTSRGRDAVRRLKADAISYRDVGMTVKSDVKTKLLVPVEAIDPNPYKPS
jgi:hypothetical protein